MRKAPNRILAINSVLLLAIAGGGYWGYSTLHPKAAAVSLQTTTVTRGDVQSTVSASGKVISPGDIGLAPLVAGTLKTLNVKVGNHVSAGDELAVLDTTSLKIAQTQALASLIAAKAAVTSAATQLQSAQTALDTANQNLTAQQTTIGQNAVNYQASVDSARKSLDDTTANQAFSVKTYQVNIDTAKNSLAAAQLSYDNYIGLYGPAGITVPWCSTINTINANCTQLMSYYQALNNAKIAVDTATQNQAASLLKDQQTLWTLQTALNTAITNQKNNLAKDQDSLTSFKNAIATAQTTLENLKQSQNIGSTEPTTAQLQLQIAQANYDQAAKNLEGATIIAPVSGDVASISTAVGGNVSTNFTQATTTTTATGFIVLTNTTSLRITASFSEADAAKVVAGQDATFTFDALSSVNATGKVLQVDILPTTSSGVTSYGATFSVDGKVPGLKVGMTATATVLTGSSTGVLQVSAQAVTTRGGSSFVNVVTTKNGKQVITPTPVIVGLKGDSSDEIQSGLKEGDKVSLPSVKASTGTNGFAVGGVPAGASALAGAGAGFGGAGGRFGG
jgi:macrolide-specific efflux system membrane fusion protein